MIRYPLIAVMTLVLPCVSWAETRMWTDITGKYQVEAEFIYFANGAVNLKKADGKIISVPMDKLSVEDQDHVKQLASSHSAGDSSSASATPDREDRRTRAEVEQMIDELGRTPPDWWDSTPLNYPATLDLSWPPKPPEPWDPQKNVGQYLWDIVQPNPGKWREGIRLVHHLLEMHAADPEKRQRAMMTLGNLYSRLLQDYARAAFWWRQAGLEQSTRNPQGVQLANCYWKLGNKQMALELLNKNALYYSTIKLLADMGETERAVQIAESAARGDVPDVAYLHAADACRIDGQYERAIEYYEQVLDVKAEGKRAQGIQRNHQRARANIAAIKVFDTLDLSRVPDGVVRGSTVAYAGDLHVEVTIRGGRIENVKVTEHHEKQTYTALTEVPRKIIERQGVQGVDATSGATITSEAIIHATAKALASAVE